MSYKPATEFLTAELDGGILSLRFNRPDALNALRPEMLEALPELIDQADSDPEVGVIVLEGKGRAFCAGVDLKVLQGSTPQGGEVGDIFDTPARSACRAMRHSSCPVIAKVHGACFTGALEIALHCDFIFTTVDTKFGDTHAKFGLRPTWGMPQVLSQAVGVRLAKELSFTARVFRGDEAAGMGVANRALADKSELDAVVATTAASVAANSRDAVGIIKGMYGIAQGGLGLDEALQEEQDRI